MNNMAKIYIKHSQKEQRIRNIVALSTRRDQILNGVELDLDALRVLVDDYEAAHMPSAAADLRRRLEWYLIQNIVSNLSIPSATLH